MFWCSLADTICYDAFEIIFFTQRRGVIQLCPLLHALLCVPCTKCEVANAAVIYPSRLVRADSYA